MGTYTATVQVKLSGDFAFFIRAERKIVRTSYPIMTPSVARGALKSILWKPDFHYRIKRITVLKNPVFHSILRNEIVQKANSNTNFMTKPKDKFSDDMRQLKHLLVLKDVSYIVDADIALEAESSQSIIKYESMFNRRLSKGQCFQHPYLGTREFSAQFEMPTGEEVAIDWTDSLGTMLFDVRYPIKGAVTIPYFFNAHINNGVMEIPDYLYEEMRR